LGRDTTLWILGSLEDWLIVLCPNYVVGMVSESYVEIVGPTRFRTLEGSDFEGDFPIPHYMQAPDNERLFLKINEYRLGSGLKPFILDDRLNEVTYLKIEDMIENQYFGHNSPRFGTPFNMLRSFGVFYKTASQNLARTADIEEAYEKMIGNWAHRANIVSRRFTNIGIAVGDNPDKPGQIYVVLIFTEK